MRSRWPRIEPGECRHRITYQQKIITGQDSFGQDQYDWVEVITLYAKVAPTGGRETQGENQRWAEADYQIAHPWTPGIREDMRVLWRDSDGLGTKYLDILNISDREGKRAVLDVMAKSWAGVDYATNPA